ncbi:hypothetical protein P3T73_03345 [Kiritimatiellota bacterium B12222]|nr:hypothetical protein P3T73_03345 [Kiritimatiellota bacterium B12222]
MKIENTKTPIPEKELRRNTLTIRFKDKEHQAVSDEAWRKRMSMSGWLRDIALTRLESEGKFDSEI